METNNTNWHKLYLAFGIITILSGIYLVFQKQYAIGIPGAIIGNWLTLDNLKKIKAENNG